MRKVLLAILVVILLIVCGLVIYNGFSIGKFEIWGIKQIVQENDRIEQANADLTTLVDVTFPESISKLNNSGELMEETKKQYEEQAVLISNSKYYMQTEKYKLEFLWTRIGNYAKNNNVTPKMEVTNGSTNGVYNLIITAVGKYSKVADFIYAIENDSRLGFKIEDFSMTQYNIAENSNLVQGKFTCKEIRIDIKSIDSEKNDSNNENNSTDKNTQNNTTNTNTTNTNTNTNTNTTNTNTTNTNTTNTNTTNTNTTNTTENTSNTTNAVGGDVATNVEDTARTTT